MQFTPDSIYAIKEVISDMASWWNQELVPDDDTQKEFIERLCNAIGLPVEEILNV